MIVTEIMDRLKEIMSEDAFKQMCGLMGREHSESGASGDDLYIKFVIPKMRQFGKKVEFKKRKLNVRNKKGRLSKLTTKIWNELKDEVQEDKPDLVEYDEILEELIERGDVKQVWHHSLWVDNNIYHWGFGKAWVMFGDSETDKELNNLWEHYDDYPQVAFTMRTLKEIEDFCNEWKKKKYTKKTYNSELFVKKLYEFL